MKKFTLILLSFFILFSCYKDKEIHKEETKQNEIEIINTWNIQTIENDISKEENVFPEEFKNDINEMSSILDNNN